MVTVGAPPSDAGGIDKHRLLIGAVVIGGIAGALVLFMKSKTPAVTSEAKAQTAAPDPAYMNLATQLLGFRGDVSVANAELANGEQDLLSAIGAESASRANADAALTSQIAGSTYTLISQANTEHDFLQNTQDYLSGQLRDVSGHVNNDPGTAIGAAAIAAADTQWANEQASFALPVEPGAGGATLRDSVLAIVGGIQDDSAQYLRHMSAGPVRHMTNAAL